MVNLKHHSDSALTFLEDVIKSKRNSTKDPDYKIRMAALEAGFKVHFATYDPSFRSDNLHTLSPAGYAGIEKEDILALYIYHSAIMQKLKQGVTTTELKRVINTCQNCTIGEINSFDHALPQGEFPEFVVHPKNLFPSCSRCNSHKSNVWRNDNGRLFLNLYLDKLPDLQYLFVTVTVRPGNIDVSFSVANPHGIEPSLFSKISYHYEKLHLCARFFDNIDDVVTPLKNNIAASLESLTIEEAVTIARGTVQRNRRSFGFNYWKSILELALLDSPAFLQLCIDNTI